MTVSGSVVIGKVWKRGSKSLEKGLKNRLHETPSQPENQCFVVCYHSITTEMCECFWADNWRVPISRVPLTSISLCLSVVMHRRALNDVLYSDCSLTVASGGKKLNLF